jgi:hypothetical protein
VCKKFSIDRKETNLVFEAQQDLKTEQLAKFKDVDEFYNTSMPLNMFLLKQNGYVDGNHLCEFCKQKCEKFKTTTLTMIPEILPVVFKKYSYKSETPFPAKLEFVSKGSTTKLVYRLVSQSEHSGTMVGGHYWAVSYRKNGWQTLNDSTVSPGRAGPTINTYMIFYHYAGEEALTDDELTVQEHARNQNQDSQVQGQNQDSQVQGQNQDSQVQDQDNQDNQGQGQP